VSDLAERIRALPGIERLLPALRGLAPTWLVGGAVRDLLLGAESVDLDVAVEGDARAVARELAAQLGGEAKLHERFGTATVRAGDLVVDLATARRERYAHAGALPMVEEAPIEDDLARRDFTINAMAAALEGARLGELLDPHGGRDDLDARVVRVLHAQSFADDPTRLLRALRYEARLGFRMDAETERLARQAIAAGAPATVSGARIRDELLDLLDEAGSGRPASSGVARMVELGLATALNPGLAGADPALVTRAAATAQSVGAQRRFAALAALVVHDPGTLAEWLDDLHLRAEDRDAVLRAARKGPQLVQSLDVPLPDSSVHALLHCELPEVFALALALGAREAPVRRYLDHLSSARLEITGDDLRAAGVPEGPAIGTALEGTLQRKLDGELAGREAELAAALRIARELPD
jgi:tRNA nucleotidyltransferase (CCA-adding enzyme)